MSQVGQVLTDGSAGKGKDIGKGILVVTPAELFVYFISNFLFFIFGDLYDCRCIKAPSYLLNKCTHIIIRVKGNHVNLQDVINTSFWESVEVD